MVSKREREYQRKREAKWQARQQAVAKKQRYMRIVAWVIVGALVLSLAGAWFAISKHPHSPQASPTDHAPASPPPHAEAEPTAAPPSPSVAENRTWTATMKTNKGDIVVSLDGKAAPQAVAAFVTLAKQGFYTNNYCHRLTTSDIFVLQCGDPTAKPGNPNNGTGGPDFRFGPIENAPHDGVYPAGTLAMARVGNNPNSNGSQFFLVWQDSTIKPDSAGGYSVFGKITAGLDILKQIAAAGTGPDGVAPADPVTIEKVELQ